MEDDSTDPEKENEDDTEEAEETEEEKNKKDQKEHPSVIMPTINIREERLVNLAETPAFRCLNEVCFFVCYY